MGMSEKRYGHLKLWTAHDLTFTEGAIAAHVEVGVVRDLARDLIAAQAQLAAAEATIARVRKLPKKWKSWDYCAGDLEAALAGPSTHDL